MTTITRMKHIEVAKIVAGPVTFQAVRLEEDGGKKHPLQFNMTVAGEPVARMGEEATRFFITAVQQVFARERDDEWTRSPTYAATEAARRAAAQRRQSAD